ncbi:MAG: pantothenate kinase [Synechococcales bacterium]|nr:pantothenate kinase [Synechococcales bacterium]
MSCPPPSPPNCQTSASQTSTHWLALMVGNSRLHWGWFNQSTLLLAWDTPHFADEAIATLVQHQLNPPPHWRADLSWPLAIGDCSSPPLWLASVVPHQTQRWAAYHPSHILTLDQIPLKNLYDTFGIDRALALCGARQQVGFPALVIDGGTALTLTAADGDDHLVGGAILPGLQLQLRSLSQSTASLPPVSLPSFETLPNRWATDTPAAIQSGVVHTVLAGLRDFIDAWWNQWPTGAVVLTGGDGPFLAHHLHRCFGQRSHLLYESPHLVILGIGEVRARQKAPGDF